MLNKKNLLIMQAIMIVEVVILCSCGYVKMSYCQIPSIRLEVEPVELKPSVMEIPNEEPKKKKYRIPLKIHTPQKLIAAIISKESTGRDWVKGDEVERSGIYLSWGCMQIKKDVIIDVNELYGTSFTHDDCLNREKSIEICRLYFDRYGRHYKSQTKKDPSMEVLARIWNGGPTGWRKSSTVEYWNDLNKNHM